MAGLIDKNEERFDEDGKYSIPEIESATKTEDCLPVPTVVRSTLITEEYISDSPQVFDNMINFFQANR